MSRTNKDDDQENTYKKHAQLITKLPKTVNWLAEELFLYQGYWFYKAALLGLMLLQDHFKPRPHDFILSSFVKSGTTWLRSLMFSTLYRSTFDFDDHPLLQKGPHEIFPWLDVAFNNMEDDIASPRLFASHFAHSLFPSSITNPSTGCKFVYVCRDPKDVIVSSFHFYKYIRPKGVPPLSFDQVFDMFCEGEMSYGPYWDHVLGFWKASIDSPNKILFLNYEEIKREPKVIVKRLGEFMGVTFSVDEEENGVVEKIVKFCSFEHLKNLEVNKNGIHQVGIGLGLEIENKSFFRRGEVGDWMNYLTPEMRQRIDSIVKEKFKGSGLIFGDL
ncbi:cytosolic sulfotransferase 16-like [Rutidosis leptorrhynchoides]|uniref:cytosolic sulfotransferase 16-like n=1 Tax=Rutidosis leptorrhynchoides TaxID=125765 RepID=UPI003A9932D8